MAIHNMSWSAFANKNTPHVLKPGLSHISSMPTISTMNNRSISTTYKLKQCCNPLKLDESLLRHITTVHLNEGINVKHAQLVKRARQVISDIKDDRFEGLVVVDALQRLGIDYHFEEEINLILQSHYLQFTDTNVHECQSLYEASFRFRILRQEGFYVPAADVFTKFKGKNGKFEENLRKDVMGLMELYEASELRIEGESVLDEAGKFCSHLLEEMIAYLDDDHARLVRQRLESSYQKSLPIFNVKNSIKDFNGTILQELAELEFTIVQSIRQTEVKHILRWWKDLGLAQELKLARDQPLKWYVWPMVALQNPNLSRQRIDLTKAISLVYIIDDLFDIYGTIDELTLFTEAVKRWNINAVELLPDYMKASFKALYDITDDIACNIYEQYGYNPINSLRKSWATLCDAFLVEAKWFSSGHLPTAEEYLNNAIFSTGVPVIGVHLFFLLGGATSNESASIINNHQCIISCVAKILRLWDDLGSAEDENQDGHDGSYVMYYMKENKGCSLEYAREHVMEMISDTWKRLNKERLNLNPFSAIFTKAWLNLARTIPLMYDYDNDHSRPLLEEFIKFMF